ncbi:MAG: hypothetical protein FWF00_02790 [Endomicrobia bacterium]|nr:hypothetical protein [Endomicrobiia bacterium]MCL2506560.1 hypothetical protein [Endomicrobiia bacterium]MCL2506603.1 hypothetical protein [Endomicrobiia bacterium]
MKKTACLKSSRLFRVLLSLFMVMQAFSSVYAQVNVVTSADFAANWNGGISPIVVLGAPLDAAGNYGISLANSLNAFSGASISLNGYSGTPNGNALIMNGYTLSFAPGWNNNMSASISDLSIYGATNGAVSFFGNGVGAHTFTIDGTYFYGNINSSSGGAVNIQSQMQSAAANSYMLTDNDFISNQAFGGGGAVYMASNNSIYSGGSPSVFSVVDNTGTNSHYISLNQSGGGVTDNGQGNTGKNTGNDASKKMTIANGGGIYFMANNANGGNVINQFTAQGYTYYQNYATGMGGAIYNGVLNGNNPAVNNFNITGGVFSQNQAGAGGGGAIANEINGGNTTVNFNINGQFYSNLTSGNGGAISNLVGDQDSPYGGTVTFNIEGSFDSNKAVNGGALYNNIQAGQSNVTVNINNVNGSSVTNNITNNFASGNGGAIYNTSGNNNPGTAVVNIADGINFYGNGANYGGAIYNTGNGVINLNTVSSLSGGFGISFQNNYAGASTQGADIYQSSSTSVINIAGDGQVNIFGGIGGKGTINQSSGTTLYLDGASESFGYTGVFNQAYGAILDSAGQMFGGANNFGGVANITSIAVDFYFNANMLSGSVMNYTADSAGRTSVGAATGAGTPGISFAGTGATVNFGTNQLQGLYLLQNDIFNGQANTINFGNSDITFGSVNYTGGTTYNFFNNSILDLSNSKPNSNEYNQYAFGSLNAPDGTTLLSFKIGNDMTSTQADTINALTGSGILGLGKIYVNDSNGVITGQYRIIYGNVLDWTANGLTQYVATSSGTYTLETISDQYINFTSIGTGISSGTTSTVNPGGGTTTTTDNPGGGSTTTTTDPSGGSTSTTTDSGSNTTSTTTTDPNGTTTTTTGSGGSTTTTTTDTGGGSSSTVYNVDGSTTTTTTNSDGSTTTTTTNTDGNSTTTTTNPGGGTSITNNNPGGTATSTITTNSDGNTTTTTTTIIDSNGSTAATTTNSDGSTSTTYTDSGGTVTVTTNPDGSVTINSTDPSVPSGTVPPGGGDIITTSDGGTITIAPGAGGTIVITVDTPDGGESIVTADPGGAGGSKCDTTDSGGNTINTTTDSGGNSSTTSTSPDDGGGNNSTTATNTNPDGSTDSSTTDTGGSNVGITTDPNGNTESTTTDGSGGTTTTTTDGSGGTSTTTNDGSGGTTTTTTDPNNGNTTTTVNNGGGDTTTTTDPNGGSVTVTNPDGSTAGTTTDPSGGATGTVTTPPPTTPTVLVLNDVNDLDSIATSIGMSSAAARAYQISAGETYYNDMPLSDMAEGVFSVYGADRTSVLSGLNLTEVEAGSSTVTHQSLFKIINDGTAKTFILEDLTIQDAYSSAGGAVINMSDPNATVSVTNLLIQNNHSDGDGGVFNVTAGVMTGWNIVYDHNTSSGNGGAVYNTASITKHGGSFTNNYAVGNGGAVYNDASDPNNMLSICAGSGGDYVTPLGTFSGMLITGNKAGGLGGAVYNAAGSYMSMASLAGADVVLDENYSNWNGTTGTRNDIYNEGTLNFDSTGGSWYVGGGFAGSGTINKYSPVVLNLAATSDSSNFVGNFNQYNGIVNINGTFFGGQSIIASGILNWNAGAVRPATALLQVISGTINIYGDLILDKQYDIIGPASTLNLYPGGSYNIAGGTVFLNTTDMLVTPQGTYGTASQSDGYLVIGGADMLVYSGAFEQTGGVIRLENQATAYLNYNLPGSGIYGGDIVITNATLFAENYTITYGAGIGTIVPTSGSLAMGDNAAFNSIDGVIQTHNFAGSFGLFSVMSSSGQTTANFMVDVDARACKSDTLVFAQGAAVIGSTTPFIYGNGVNVSSHPEFTVKDVYATGGFIMLEDINLINMPITEVVPFTIIDPPAAPFSDPRLIFVATDKKYETAAGIYGLYSMGMGNYELRMESINPAAPRGQAALLAMFEGQLTANGVLFDHVFFDSNQMVVDEYKYEYKFLPRQFFKENREKSYWVKTYYENERLSVSDSVDLKNNLYGAIFGLDFAAKDIGGNSYFMPSVFAGYTGESQSLASASMSQNAVRAGFMASVMVNDVYTASALVYGGGYGNNMEVKGNEENLYGLFAGAAVKNSYNMYMNNFVLQPFAMASYIFYGKQSWNSSYGNIEMETDSMNGFTLSPGANLIYALDTWSFLAGGAYVYNLGDRITGRIGNIELPAFNAGLGYFEWTAGASKIFSKNLNIWLKGVYKTNRYSDIGVKAGAGWRF